MNYRLYSAALRDESANLWYELLPAYHWLAIGQCANLTLQILFQCLVPQF